jgi:hypothetical protein
MASLGLDGPRDSNATLMGIERRLPAASPSSFVVS